MIFIVVTVLAMLILIGAIILNGTGRSEKPEVPTTSAPPKAKQSMKSKMTVRLTMRSLIRWEQLRNKSFSLMDYSSEEDMEALLYCSVLSCNRGTLYTLEEFRHMMQNEKLVKQMVQTLARESTVMEQFRQEKGTSQEAKQDPGEEPGFIKDIISTLIMSGLDATYVMDEMKLCDLPLFISAYEKKRKEQMESDRLWTYLNILPHVDGKKLPSARELYPFPWEMEEMKEKADKAIREDSEKLEMFFNQGKNLINQSYGR